MNYTEASAVDLLGCSERGRPDEPTVV